MSSSETANYFHRIKSIYELSVDILLLSIGLISNILIILIFTTLRIFRGNRSAYYLKTESIANICLFLALFPSNIAGYVLNENPARLSVIWCKIQLMSVYACGLYSLFATCFLALHQYLSTNHRQHWRQMNTLKLAHQLTVMSIIIVIIHAILFLIFGDLGEKGCSIYQSVAKIYFSFFFYPILSAILPIIFSGSFSLLAYRNVRRIIRRQISLVRRRLDHQMTAIALGRVISLIVFGIPFVIYSVVTINISVTDDELVKKAILDLLFSIMTSLLYTNFATNFYLFLIISPRFRNQVKHCFTRRRFRSIAATFKCKYTISRSNQVCPDSDQRQISAINVESV